MVLLRTSDCRMAKHLGCTAFEQAKLSDILLSDHFCWLHSEICTNNTQRVSRRIQEAPVITWRASIDPLLTLRISSPIKVQVRLLAVCGHWQTRTAGSAIRVKGGQKRPQIKGARQVLVIPILYRPPLHEKTIPKTVRNECCPGAFNTAKQQNEMYLTYFKFGQPAHLSSEPLQLRVKRAHGLNRLTISDFLLSAKQPS